MKLMKLNLLIIALTLFVASSSFASLSYNISYNISVDTTGLDTSTGYLYFTYVPLNGAESTTAMVSGFAGGTLATASSPDGTLGGSIGTLPSDVIFSNTNGSSSDYNHGITFGNIINFKLLFSSPTPGGQAGGSSTFSLGLFSDQYGSSPLLNVNGLNHSYPGTLFTVSLMNDGTTSFETMTDKATVTAAPIPTAVILLVSGLIGMVGIRRRMQF